MMAKVSVIVLTWNGKQFLDDCLLSMEAQTFKNFETVLVDNGSTDGSSAYIRENFPWVKLVELPDNVGFSEGNNRGFAECQGDYIVTLNNDTKVDPAFLAELVKPADLDPRVGIVAAKILNYYETGRIDSVGIRAATTGLGINLGVGETDRGQYDASGEIFGACAGAALYRRSMLEEAGFFDPDFFAYYEDLDLAWRGRLTGWKAVTAPKALVYHVHSATAGRMSAFTVYHTHRNKWYVIIKNWPLSQILRYLPLIMAYDAASLLLAAMKGRIVPSLRARLHLLAAIPSLLKKREKVMSLQKISSDDINQLLMPAASTLKILRRKMGSGV